MGREIPAEVREIGLVEQVGGGQGVILAERIVPEGVVADPVGDLRGEHVEDARDEDRAGQVVPQAGVAGALPGRLAVVRGQPEHLPVDLDLQGRRGDALPAPDRGGEQGGHHGTALDLGDLR